MRVIRALLEQMQDDWMMSILDDVDQTSLSQQLKLLYDHRDNVFSEMNTLRELIGIDLNAGQAAFDGPEVRKEHLLRQIYGPRRAQVDAKIADLERLLGPDLLGPDISRIRWAAKLIEQANARIAALENQLYDRVAPMVIVTAQDN